MNLKDVKIGMKLKSTLDASYPFDIVTVTGLTDLGFKYSISEEWPFIPRRGESFAKDGHEAFGFRGEVYYEPYEYTDTGGGI